MPSSASAGHQRAGLRPSSEECVTLEAYRAEAEPYDANLIETALWARKRFDAAIAGGWHLVLFLTVS
jgi:hypothetical protein